MQSAIELGVSDFVALTNQTLEFAYPVVVVTGELAHFKVSKNRWVYFDLKDELASVRFFGTVYNLPGPLQDGMLLAVKGTPRLHPQYGFSVQVMAINPVGEGSIKKAQALLRATLEAEGLFEPSRKRVLPYPPAHIGLITSAESAAMRDFTKILSQRWGGIHITLIDVQVQGDAAPMQVAEAIGRFNQLPAPPDVLVVIRGGGSADDLQAFSTEHVTRAVAGSRIPTLVAIGHEVDVSLAELAADSRASTPSNAAELLVPDKKAERAVLGSAASRLEQMAQRVIKDVRRQLADRRTGLNTYAQQGLAQERERLAMRARLLAALDPYAALRRGYAIVYQGGRAVPSGRNIRVGQQLDIRLADSRVAVEVKKVTIIHDETDIPSR